MVFSGLATSLDMVYNIVVCPLSLLGWCLVVFHLPPEVLRLVTCPVPLWIWFLVVCPLRPGPVVFSGLSFSPWDGV